VSKKRFGISLPSEVAESLDLIAGLTGTDRSSIVAEAVNEYLHDHSHYVADHECAGLLVAVSTTTGHGRGGAVAVSEFSDIVKHYAHYHVEGVCVEVIVVVGSSGRILELHNKLKASAEAVRFIPLRKWCKLRGRDMGV